MEIKVRITDITETEALFETYKVVRYEFPACQIQGEYFFVKDGKVQFTNRPFVTITFPLEIYSMSYIKKKIKTYFPSQLRPLITIEDVRDYIKNQDNKR